MGQLGFEPRTTSALGWCHNQARPLPPTNSNNIFIIIIAPAGI